MNIISHTHLRTTVKAITFILCCFALSQLSASPSPSVPLVKKQEQLVLPDSAIYVGQYRDGLLHGTGQLQWRNGDTYKGEFKKGLMHGKGEFVSVSGYQYTGDFRDGMMHGKGFYQTEFDGQYKGAFKDGYFHGQGRFVDTNGDVYDGLFKKNAPNGKGVIIYKQGDDYIGEIQQWKMHGEGIYTVTDGNIYSGQFVDGVQTGQGKIVYRSGDIYTGEIEDWQSHGKGEYKFASGMIYKGTFANGLYEGEGILEYANGSVYKGSFKNGMMHGKGSLTLAKPKGRLKVKVGWWSYGRFVGKEEPVETAKAKSSSPVKLDAEAIFYKQNDMLETTLKMIKPGTPAVDMYVVNFAAHGSQDVFMKEARFTKNLFDNHYQTQGRSLSLINNPMAVETTLLASVTNLKKVLQHISGLMNVDEDILFLFLTSHGSKDHKLDVSLKGLPLNDLPASDLAKMLKESKIKWKVIVVSSCYSGGFIKELKDDTTLIMTSSRADHVSFGCSDEAEFTFFGRALFKEAMPSSSDFVQAFNKAFSLVNEWENEENYDHSEPQLWTNKGIEMQLKKWRSQLSPTK